MNDITVQDIVSAGQDYGMRISVEANPGFIGDRQVTVTFRGDNCSKENIVRTLVGALFDYGDKVTIYGDVHYTDGDLPNCIDAFVNFRVDSDSTVTRTEIEETDNETGSDSTLNV